MRCYFTNPFCETSVEYMDLECYLLDITRTPVMFSEFPLEKGCNFFEIQT
jgi:hypothetical protein